MHGDHRYYREPVAPGQDFLIQLLPNNAHASQAANRLQPTEAVTYARATRTRPSRSSERVSQPKAEKVVKPPNSPTERPTMSD